MNLSRTIEIICYSALHLPSTPIPASHLSPLYFAVTAPSQIDRCCLRLLLNIILQNSDRPIFGISMYSC
jgi:hypothetical protein